MRAAWARARFDWAARTAVERSAGSSSRRVSPFLKKAPSSKLGWILMMVPETSGVRVVACWDFISPWVSRVIW